MTVSTCPRNASFANRCWAVAARIPAWVRPPLNSGTLSAAPTLQVSTLSVSSIFRYCLPTEPVSPRVGVSPNQAAVRCRRDASSLAMACANSGRSTINCVGLGMAGVVPISGSGVPVGIGVLGARPSSAFSARVAATVWPSALGSKASVPASCCRCCSTSSAVPWPPS
jgi:hypothetical protein